VGKKRFSSYLLSMVLVRFFVLNKEVTVGPGRLCRLPYGEGEGNAHTLFY